MKKKGLPRSLSLGLAVSQQCTSHTSGTWSLWLNMPTPITLLWNVTLQVEVSLLHGYWHLRSCHFACQSRSWFALYTLGCIKQPITTSLTISNTMWERNLCSQGIKCPVWFRTKSYSIILYFDWYCHQLFFYFCIWSVSPVIVVDLHGSHLCFLKAFHLTDDWDLLFLPVWWE